MKCPKCGYLGFQAVDRCRNCGYDFSLTASADPPELSLRLDDPDVSPLDDLALVDAAVPKKAAQPLTDVAPDLDRMLGGPSTPPPRSKDLPLFGAPTPDDQPLITHPSPPRQPLAVRRATPDVPRLRADQPRLQSLDLLDDSPSALGRFGRSTTAANAEGDDSMPQGPQVAGIVARFLAVAIDVVILAIIDVAVVYFTLEICGITVGEFGILPKGPLVAFLIVQNGGYLVAFTAGGQTLGKMVAGIRVVPAEPGSPLDLGHAFVRELMWVVLAIPAGLGFLTALFSRDHRGLHDRFAGTRVVR
jgi:uncharacterized RDD family membrane protein YckC